MTGEGFIRLANRLALQRGAAEPEYRTAARRAYDGAYHLAASFLDEIGARVPEGPQAHVFVQLRLIQCGQPDAAVAGRLLRDLHSDRLKADYRLSNPRAETKQFAIYSLESVERFRPALAACSQEPARTAVMLGIQAYERAIEDGASTEP